MEAYYAGSPKPPRSPPSESAQTTESPPQPDSTGLLIIEKPFSHPLFLSGWAALKLQSGDALVVHRSQDSRVVILEYEVHGKILSTGVSYDNRLISVVTIEKRKIVHWRDYMDSLAAWTALNSPYRS